MRDFRTSGWVQRRPGARQYALPAEDRPARAGARSNQEDGMRRRGGVALQPGREHRAEMAPGREDGRVAGWRVAQDRRAQMACEGQERQGAVGTERRMRACGLRFRTDVRKRFARSRGGGILEHRVDQEGYGRRLRIGESPASAVGFMMACDSLAPNKECERNQRQQHREWEPSAIHDSTLACRPNQVNTTCVGSVLQELVCLMSPFHPQPPCCCGSRGRSPST